MAKASGIETPVLSDRALYRRGEEALYRSARIHFFGRRGALRKMVRRYLKPHRRDRAFLRSLTASVARVLVVALLMLHLLAQPASAGNVGPFVERTTGINPFNGVSVGLAARSVPAFVDVDNDGDYDAFIGETTGAINYYQNTGSATSPTFTAQTGTSNPFNGVDVGSNSAPTFVDIDNDGDRDVFIGETNGAIKYYRNEAPVGTPTPPVADLDASRSVDVSVAFNGAVTGGSSSSFVVHGDQSGQRSGDYSTNTSCSPECTTTLSFNPSADFHPGEEVEVRLTPSIVFSTGGTAMAPARVYRFRAAAGSGPAAFSNVSSNFGHYVCIGMW